MHAVWNLIEDIFIISVRTNLSTFLQHLVLVDKEVAQIVNFDENRSSVRPFSYIEFVGSKCFPPLNQTLLNGLR